MRRERLQEILALSDADVLRLSDCGLILPSPEKPPRRPKIDFEKLAKTFRGIIDREGFTSQSDLARHLGASRVWVSRVLKGIRRKAG